MTVATISDDELLTAERRRIAAMRMSLLEAHPFWGYLLLQVSLVPAPHLPHFVATDGLRHIWYNPALTAQLSPAQLGFVFLHEIGHQLFWTGARRAGRDEVRWGQATDYAINRIILRIQREDGWYATPAYEPPSGYIAGMGRVEALIDPAYDGLPAEAIYEQLLQDEPIPECARVAVELPLEPIEAPDGGIDEASLCSRPQRSMQFAGVADHHGGVDLHLPITPSLDDRTELGDRIALAVEHWQASNQRGDVPGDDLRLLGVLDPPRVPWERELHRFMDEAIARDEYSRTRPNKRYLDEDIIVPGLSGERVGSIVVALDTSGSMSEAQLRVLLGEVRDIAEQAVDVTLIVADSAVQAVVAGDDLDAYLSSPRVPGGGGTDHRPVFEYITENHLQPSVFIGITDLYSALPTVPPPFPVVWCTTRDHGYAPWGRVIVAEH